MSRSKRSTTAAFQVQLLREGIPETHHQVDVTVCDRRGRVLMTAGDPDTSSFIRSCLKPFQALAVATTGAMERYELGDRDLAIMCASHDGSAVHARQSFNILWHSDVDVSALQCPVPEGHSSPLAYNCSGKHAGMLAVCKHYNWPLREYMERQHPVQQLIAQQLGDCLGMSPAELLSAKDDCGVPTYFMQLRQMATLYAQLASGDRLDLERVIRSMTHHPDLIAGPGQFDTELMRRSNGTVVSKSGAEGVQCIGRVGEGMGLAIKVADGAKRAKYAVAIHVLRQMGWIDPIVADDLSEQFMSLDRVRRLDVVGDLAMV
jgi:L-asparaginase